jgi:hypothetical protein
MKRLAAGTVLTLVDAHVAASNLRVARQMELIQKLQASRKDTSRAETLLVELEKCRARCIADRDRVRQLLERLD